MRVLQKQKGNVCFYRERSFKRREMGQDERLLSAKSRHSIEVNELALAIQNAGGQNPEWKFKLLSQWAQRCASARYLAGLVFWKGD